MEEKNLKKRPRFVYFAGAILIIVIWLVRIVPVFSEESEARAVWVTRWDYKTKDDVIDIIKNAADSNFNMVLFQVRGNANAFYPSNYEPWAEELGGSDPGFDPLAVAIAEAHKRDVELHAYVNVYPAWKGTDLPLAPTQIFNLHPEWICMGKSGRRIGLNEHYVYLSPGIPEAKDHIYNVFMDIVSRYAIDGLHLDYVRYPERDLNGFVDEYSYDAQSLERFRKRYLKSPEEAPEEWANWRREQVTDLVRRVFFGMKRIRPNAKLSASVWGDYQDGHDNYYQESQEWLKEGTIDFVTPMIYTTDTVKFVHDAKNYRENCYGRPVFPGIGCYRFKTPEETIERMKLCRELGFRGMAIFSYVSMFPSAQTRMKGRWDTLGEERATLVRLIKEQVFQEKVPVPTMMPYLR